jgi:geranylgeranyl diphosphate synthase type II
MYETYKAGGKRNRPYETVLTYQLLGGTDYQKVLPVAAATELLHTSLLAMDDVIDRDYMRHSQPNIAGRYIAEYKSVIVDEIDRTHYADSAAILAESLMLHASQYLIVDASLTEQERQKVLRIFDEAIFIVAGGEFLDVEAAFVADTDKADWQTIAEHKTADYSFVTPMILGATLANATSEVQTTIRKIGRAMGIAYQLADDLLGIFVDEAETGKPAFGDVAEAKMTYLMAQTLAKASGDDVTWLKQLLGSKPIQQADGERVRAIMEQCGAKTATEAKIAEYVDEAKRQLATLHVEPIAEQTLSSLIDKVAWRNS